MTLNADQASPGHGSEFAGESPIWHDDGRIVGTANRTMALGGLDLSTIEADFRRRAEARRALALPRAVAALRRLEAMGFRAWVVGSLAKEGFSPHSDVDFVVDCPEEREGDAFLAIEKAMGDFPFHMVPRGRILEDALPLMMEGALDASRLVARQAPA